MNWTEAELHQKAWEAFQAFLAGPPTEDDSAEGMAEFAYKYTLAFLAERERRGWTGANTGPGAAPV